MRIFVIYILLLSCIVSQAYSITLSWNPYTSTNLAGYKVYYGNTPESYSFMKTVPPNVNSAVMSGLYLGDWYFSIAATNKLGNESPLSNEVKATLSTNDPPPETYMYPVSLYKNTSVNINLVAYDQFEDIITFSILAGPFNGSISGTPPTLYYTPYTNFVGYDYIDYSVRDWLTTVTSKVDIFVVETNVVWFNVSNNMVLFNPPPNSAIQYSTDLKTWIDTNSTSFSLLEPKMFFRLKYLPPPIVISKVKIEAVYTKTGLTPLSVTASNIPPNALLLLMLANEADFSQNNVPTITSSPNLNWVNRATASGSQSGNAQIWTASGNGNQTVTVSYNNTVTGGLVLYVLSNANTIVQTKTAVAQTAPSIAFSTTSTNSTVFVVTSDWKAITGTATYRRNVQIVSDYFVSGIVRIYNYYENLPGAGSYTEGLSSPSSQSAGSCLIEIKP